jgi:hypothetical protein
MLAILISSLAFAQDVPDGLNAPSTIILSQPQSVQMDRKGGKGPKGKRKGKRGKKEEWRHRFYARPTISGSSFTTPDGETSTAFGLGGEGGVRYWETNKPFPRLRGRTRGTVEYIMSTNTTGMAAKVGSFMGPAWKHFALESGLDLSWDRYEWNGIELEPTIGASVPLIATTGIKGLSLYVGAQPTWVNNAERVVDWDNSAHFGFGHEFSTFFGGSIAIDDMSLVLGYSRRVTAIGVQEGYGISTNIRG